MADLVERLRAPVLVERKDGIRLEAALEIEMLREEIKTLRLMLEDYERVYGHDGSKR